MKLLVLSCSLSAESRSARMAQELVNRWPGRSAELVDLRSVPLPFCDAGPAYADSHVVALGKKIEGADALALAVPIYNYDVGGAARNLLAMTGRVWQEKIVGLMAAAGGERSYMSLMPVANSLMLDFRCVIVPRMVYASPATLDGTGPIDGELELRIEGLAQDLLRFSKALTRNT